MKTTRYFDAVRSRPDRRDIKEAWIRFVIEHFEREIVQTDGRRRRWARIQEANGKWLRVVLLPDATTVHNAFFDRDFRP